MFSADSLQEKLCLIVLILTALFIIYQDFRNRLISLWLILVFAVFNTLLYIIRHTFSEWTENLIFCTMYCGFCYLVLHLYFYVKTKKFEKILDKKIGWGDILLIFCVGSCIRNIYQIYFFTVTYFIALLYHLLFEKRRKDIALAGILLICYLLFFFLREY
jgi:hypothetical protein